MRLLDRYLLRELLLPLGYCLGGFLIFWISFDLIGDLDKFQDRQLGFSDVVEYYLITSPELFLVIMPIALLLALLYALTTHARYNELTAMRAAGISIWRLAAPYFGVGLFFGILFFVVNEFWVPSSIEKAEAILNRYNPKESKTMDGDWRRDLKFLNPRDNRAWWIKAYNMKTSEMEGVIVDWNFPDGKQTTIFAQKAVFENGVWRFFDVNKIDYQSKQSLTNMQRSAPDQLEFSGWSESPALIKSEIKINNLESKDAAKRPQLSIADILNYLKLHPRPDKATRALVNTQLHGRIAAPATCLIVVLIALPFGAVTGRRNVFVGVASSIFICFSYFILLRLGLALGTAGYLPGWLAAWLPNILFGATAIWFTMKVR